MALAEMRSCTTRTHALRNAAQAVAIEVMYDLLLQYAGLLTRTPTATAPCLPSFQCMCTIARARALTHGRHTPGLPLLRCPNSIFVYWGRTSGSYVERSAGTHLTLIRGGVVWRTQVRAIMPSHAAYCLSALPGTGRAGASNCSRREQSRALGLGPRANPKPSF